MKNVNVAISILFYVIFFHRSKGWTPADNSCYEIEREAQTKETAFKTTKGKNPWHVNIYHFQKNDYYLICSGVIINAHAVLTAANCVFKKPAKELRVVAGKLSSYYKWNDNDVQDISVMNVVVHSDYLGKETKYAQNVALLGLIKEFDFNSIIKPVCIIWDKPTPNTKYIETVGWGVNDDHTLYDITLSWLDNAACLEKFPWIRHAIYINFDKFCTVTPEGRYGIEVGAAAVVKSGKHFILKGIFSKNINRDFSLVTILEKYHTWMKEVLLHIDSKFRCDGGFYCSHGTCIKEGAKCDGIKDCPDGEDESATNCPISTRLISNGGSCVLPTQRGGASFEIIDCDPKNGRCTKNGGARVPMYTKLKLNCGTGYSPPEGAASAYVCLSSSLFPEDPQCIKLCPKLNKTNINFTCNYKGSSVNCTNFHRNGTIAYYKCNKYYKIQDPTAFSGYIECLNDGKWKGDLPSCDPECGVSNVPDDVERGTVIAGGKTVDVGRFPWHADLFHLRKYNNSFIRICGGTIISEHMVITVAHGLFNQKLNERFKVQELTVAAGKTKRSFYTHEHFQQSSRVKKLIINENYKGYEGAYEYDIAIIQLETPFVLNSHILPVCIDYGSFYHRTSKFATVIGYGFTKKKTNEEDLKETQMEMIGVAECKKRYESFKMYLRYDKLCGLYINGSGPGLGDSGEGITFLVAHRFYLMGIVSIKPIESNEFCAITNLETHFDWVKAQVFNQRRKSGEF